MLRSADKRLALNETVSGEVFNQDWPEHIGSSRERIIHPGSPEFGTANYAICAPSASSAWASANKPMAVPFRVFKGMTVYQLGWVNGTGTIGDAYDIGIYDAAWSRKISTGSVARATASAVQWTDVADTFLPSGKYYVVQASSGTTLNQLRIVGPALTAGMMAALGCFDSATNAFPLPDPLTNMVAAATFTIMPYCLIAARVPF